MVSKFNFKISHVYSFFSLYESGDIAIFNGTRHTLHFFDFRNRRENDFLVQDGDKPVFTIPASQPLNIRFSRQIVLGDKPDCSLDLLTRSEFKKYDIIIVNRAYFRALSKQLAEDTINISSDFLDRLYLPVCVRSGKKTVGLKDVVKAFPPQSPQEYLATMKKGNKPSLVAMLDSLALYENDYFSSDGIEDLDSSALLLKYICDGYSKNRNSDFRRFTLNDLFSA